MSYIIPDEVFQDVASLIGKMKEFNVPETYDIMVAGGAIRDQLNGQPVKDWDIFLSGPDDFFISPQLRNHLIKTMRYGQSIDYDANAGAFAVFNDSSHLLGDPDKQIIIRRGEGYKETLEAFDFSICKVGHLFYSQGKPVENPLVMTPEYAKCIKDEIHEVRLIKPVSEGAINHVERILKKYPWPCQIELVESKPVVVSTLPPRTSKTTSTATWKKVIKNPFNGY
jgi:hypothetical protein